MHPLHRDPSHFPPYDERPIFSPSLVTIGGFEYVEVSLSKYISSQEFQELQEREKISRLSTNLSRGMVSHVLSNDQLARFPIEPFSEFTPKLIDLNAHVDRLGQGFSNIERIFEFVQDPYDNTNYGSLSFVMLLMSSWVKDLNYDKEIWMHSPMMCSLVSEATLIFKDALETLSQL